MSLTVDVSRRPVAPADPIAPTVPASDAVIVAGGHAERLPYPPLVQRRIVWRYAAPIALIHLAAMLVFVPWFFSWSGLAIGLVGTYVFGGIGINLCYHRMLTHRSFKVPLWLERCFVLVSLCCMEDAPATWVATHRQHHNESDHYEDPHSPLVNFLWSHIGWLLLENSAVRSSSAFDKYARDILRDPFYMRLQRTFLPVWIYLAHALLYYAAGFAAGYFMTGTLLGGVQLGLSWLIWGCLARTVVGWHISWSVNSLTHVFGYRTYETGDNSRNNWLVALVGNGEGWHNNHHADPASASVRHRWWELDPIFAVIVTLEWLGLATQVIRPRLERQGKPGTPARVS